MNSKQFAQSWDQLKQYVPARWEKVTKEDLHRINGGQTIFDAVIGARLRSRAGISQALDASLVLSLERTVCRLSGSIGLLAEELILAARRRKVW